MPDQPDYIFRYPLENTEGKERDAPLEMIRAQLEGLLGLLTFYHNGEEVRVDGFRLMNERETIHRIFPDAGNSPSAMPTPKNPSEQGTGVLAHQSLRSAGLYEPRIPYIKKLLETVLSIVTLEAKGNPISADGFRLKDLEDWLIPSPGDPAEVFDHLATNCDCGCSFCYLRGNPPSLALDNAIRPPREEYDEARTREKYFSPAGKRALFPSLGSPYEVLKHPYILDLLARLRQKSDRPFRFSTNGNVLTSSFIERLAQFRPVYLYLSLNSSAPERRKFLMKGVHPETAIDSLPLLKKNGIPYAVVIVPWPFPSLAEMLADLEETVAYADRYSAQLVEVSLPGYSRYFDSRSHFDLDEVWPAIVNRVRSLREKVSIPLLVKPSLYEEGREDGKLNLPRVLGLVKGSPAAASGLRAGDLILSIGGLKTSSRPQARDLLRLHHQRKTPSLSLSVQRSGEVLEFTMGNEVGTYPYDPETTHHGGIIFRGAGLRAEALENLKSIISARGARRVLFFSSRLVEPVFRQHLREFPFPGNVEIQVEVPKNEFFGGNIFMGDLLVVRDFIAAAREHLGRNPPPDLIVIPSTPFSLGDWQRDLEGRPFTEIERAVGIPVVLLECEPIYD